MSKTNLNEKFQEFLAMQEPEPVEHNSAEKVSSYETTDGQLFKVKKDADTHQLRVDFQKWYTDENLAHVVGLTALRFLSVMIENRTELMKFMRRVK